MIIAGASGDGLNLFGDVFNTDTQSHKWLIAIHGYTGKREHMYSYARFYAEKGYNILTPDMRSHGDSEGKLIGMGWLDKEDVKLWIDYVLDIDPEAEIVLHRVSMGGATVMMTAGEDLPDNVKAVIDDCGYTSVWDEFTDEAKYLFNISQFPILYTASAITKLRAGYVPIDSSEFCWRHGIVLFKYFNEIIIIGVAYIAADFLNWKICLLQEIGSFFAAHMSYVLRHGFTGFLFEYLGQVRDGHIGTYCQVLV